MCKPYSCIIKSDLALIEGKTVATHSHTEILKQHGLPTEISVDQYARVELIPSDSDGTDYSSDLETWRLVLDEHRTPSWWKDNLPEIEDRVKRAAEKWKAKLRAIKKWEVVDGEYFICFGDMKPELNVSGGKVRAYDISQPVITTVSGGEVWTCGNSQPVITTVSGGKVWTCGNSQPVITTVSGGEVWTCDSSQPVITTVSGSEVWTFGNSQPVITTVSGGKVRAYDSSQPVITTVSGGEVWTCGNSQPVIKEDTRC